MTIHADHGPGLIRPSTSKAPDHPPRRAVEDREWLVLLGAVLVAILVFGAMVGLTMLGGGDGYVPWND
ncbi:MAG: hypothetical protein JHC71_19795 [Blastococcus sp.]|nr:hypothetical protein [Blastococcus sp.]